MIDNKELGNLAKLASLTLAEEEILPLQDALTDILRLIGQLQEHDTTDIQPVTHPLDMVQRTRSDRVTETLGRDQLQAGAPAVADGFYLVPQVVEHGN